MIRIAHGVLNWMKEERVTNRYGKFFLDACPFSMGPPVVCAVPWNDAEAIERLRGKKVLMRCVVLAVRSSEHVGDMFLGILPSCPNVDEVIDLGVGIFEVEEPAPDTGSPIFVLQPGDGREKLWIDPRILYRLHSQTVDVFLEETEAECTPAADLSCAEPGRIYAGEGFLQAKEISEEDTLKPVPPKKIEKLGGGTFMIHHDRKFGERIE
jgi:hypothetical protein